MSALRIQTAPMVLVVAGVLLTVTGGIARRGAMDGWSLAIFAGAACCLASIIWLFRRASQDELELQRQREASAREREELVVERQRQSEIAAEIEENLLQQQQHVETREQALADRFAAYHEWMEFPQPVDLAEARPDVRALDELSELAEKDRRLHQLLGETAQRLFEDIHRNKYAPDGKVDLDIIRDDSFRLIRDVARIYQSDADQPLLETSLEEIIRSSSRACLQLLTVLDDLPIDVKQYNVNHLYGHVRKAVDAYGMYKKAEPYWPYFNTAYLLGRFAMGVHPISLGAWWFAGTLGTRAAKALTTRVVNRQALALLHQSVRVIGYEVASVYGAGFRYRDANWIYAAELTELMTVLPVSHDCLSQALREVGALQLRSEFDRVFLYRCLAERTSATGAQYAASSVLTVEERNAVARRLERFSEAYRGASSPKRFEQWRQGVEQRLDVKLNIAPQAPPDDEQLRLEAIRCVGGFLVEVKQLDPEEAGDRLDSILLELDADDKRRAAARKRWDENPAFFFELPDLPPQHKVCDEFLRALALATVGSPPRDEATLELLDSAGGFLRKSKKQMREIVRVEAVSELTKRLDSPPPHLPLEVALAALDLLADDGDRAGALYGNVRLEWPQGPPADWDEATRPWLLVQSHRLLLFAANRPPRLLWSAESDSRAEQDAGYLSSDCLIHGGRWLDDENFAPIIRVQGGAFQRYADFFAALRKCQALA